MIQFAGSIRGKKHHPYIYAIAKKYCLYIGETQQHPASRWGQHLATNGSFLNRLREADEDVYLSDEDIIFFCIDCVQIAELSPEEHKLVTQYVEHRVHEKCILNLPRLSPIEKIISDTTRTAPPRCRHNWADQVAELAFQEIQRRLSEALP